LQVERLVGSALNLALDSCFVEATRIDALQRNDASRVHPLHWLVAVGGVRGAQRCVPGDRALQRALQRFRIEVTVDFSEEGEVVRRA